MMKKTLLWALPWLAAALAAAPPPSIPDAAAAGAEKTLANRPAAAEMMAQIRRSRDELVKAEPFDIVRAKKLLAPSGDPHDYICYGPYWWPDPTKPDGKPYIRKDGEIYPPSRGYDDRILGRMCDQLYQLALLWYFTGDREAAERAALQLRVFFVDPATRMNPHLRYGQAVPGVSEGRVYGVIDSRKLILATDAIAMLDGSPALTPELKTALSAWFRAYAGWLITDPMPREDWKVEQNHGISYHGQVINFSLAAGNRETAREHAAIVRELAVKMVAPDGSLPRETMRTRSWHYSLFALELLFNSAGTARNLGVDYFAPGSESRAAIVRAVDYLCSFIGRPEAWPHRNLEPIDFAKLTPIVQEMYFYTGDPKYLEVLKKLPAASVDARREVLFFAPPNQ